MRYILMFSVVAFGLSPLSNWATATAKAEPNSVLRVRISDEPRTADWNKVYDAATVRLISQIMEGLTVKGENFRVQPALAKSWATSKDGTRYTFHLRKGTLWSDGVEVNAQQFVDSWLRILDPKTASPAAELLFDIVGAAEFNSGVLTDRTRVGLAATDPYTLVVRLKHPANYFVGITEFPSFGPIRLDLILKYGDRWTEPDKLATVGPYHIQKWEHGQKITMVRNENYYGKRPGPDGLEYILVPEDSTALNMFEAGKLDFLPNLPPTEVHRLKGLKQFHIDSTMRSLGYRFNVKVKPFDDVRVRLAFAHAIDKATLTRLLGGGQTPLNGWVPSGIPDYDPEFKTFYDPVLAKKLLAEAGYPDGKGFPEVTAYFDASDANRMVAERLQANWKETLGVLVELKSQDNQALLARVRSPPNLPALFKFGWGMLHLDPYDILKSTGPGPLGAGWVNSEYVSLVEGAAAEKNPKKRFELYAKAERIMVEREAVILPLYQDSMPYLLSERVKKLGLYLGSYCFKDSIIKE